MLIFGSDFDQACEGFVIYKSLCECTYKIIIKLTRFWTRLRSELELVRDNAHLAGNVAVMCLSARRTLLTISCLDLNGSLIRLHGDP